MKKEVILAIIIGALLGIVVAFGIWRANGALKLAGQATAPSTSPHSSSTPGTTTAPAATTNTSQLAIFRPENEEVSTTDHITVNGSATPNSKVIIDSENSSYIAQVDASGNFTVDNVGLVGGINSLIITTFSNNSQLASKVVTVVLTNPLAVSSPEPTSASGSADAIRNRVQEKLNEATNKPKAYIGTITDKTESGLQIKTPDAQISQVALNKSVEYIRLAKPQNKAIEFAELGIGDFVVAIGYKNANGTLNARRVLITSTPDLSKRKTYIGTVSATDKKSVIISSADGPHTITGTGLKIYLFDTDAKLITKRLSDINIGDTVIGVDPVTVYIVTQIPKATVTPKATSKPTPKP
jgi:hypothetical protein